jgi:enamine deaminase RidA (YjgF/YER057c/UK114 family)
MSISRKSGSDAFVTRPKSGDESIEMGLLGLLDEQGNPLPVPIKEGRTDRSVERDAITNLGVLNEAYDYPIPSSFSRGLRVEMKAGSTILYISGTASVDEKGDTVYAGDFRAQCWRTWRNITELLSSQGATWHDIVRTTCYLRDIERDYRDFNEIRTHFFEAENLDPLPASTGIQARLCREDLLIEIEAIAILQKAE